MKIENYTTSALFLVGFFGIFILMNFQTSIAGTTEVSENKLDEMSSISVSQDFLPDTLHWRKIE